MVFDEIYRDQENNFEETLVSKRRASELEIVSPLTYSRVNCACDLSIVDLKEPWFFVNPFKLYIVHSFSQTFTWSTLQGEGFLQGLLRKGFEKKNFYLKTFWMDAKDVKKFSFLHNI